MNMTLFGNLSRRAPRVAAFGFVNVHLFNSGPDRSVFGFTGDRTGANLPLALAPWYSVDSRKMCPGIRIAGVGMSDGVLAAIETIGHYLVRGADRLAGTTPAPRH